MDSFLFYSLFFRNQPQEASSLNFLGIGIDEYAVVTLLAVQALALLHDDENATDSHGEDKQHESCHETEDAVAEDEARYGSTCGGCRPVDVASLQPEELQWTLQSLENGIVRKSFLLCISHNCQCFNVLHTRNLTLRLTSNAEEQRQCLGCCNEENTCADDHHDLLLENLLNFCK